MILKYKVGVEGAEPAWCSFLEAQNPTATPNRSPCAAQFQRECGESIYGVDA